MVPNEIVVTFPTGDGAHDSDHGKIFPPRWISPVLNNLEAWYDIYGREAELPKMLYLECPYEILEQRF